MSAILWVAAANIAGVLLAFVLMLVFPRTAARVGRWWRDL